MDADTGYYSWLVLEAHGGQVQTATTHDMTPLITPNTQKYSLSQNLLPVSSHEVRGLCHVSA